MNEQQKLLNDLPNFSEEQLLQIKNYITIKKIDLNFPYEFDFYAVCFIDLIGQRDFLDLWKKYYYNDSLQFDNIREKTTERVISLRSYFQNAIQDINKIRSNITQSTILQDIQEKNPQYAKWLINYQTKCHPIKVQTFSDSLCIYVKLVQNDGIINLAPLYSFFVSCSYAMFMEYSNGNFFRGAISVGPGVILSNGDFYGIPLFETYNIESKITNYFRIVISENVEKILSYTLQQESSLMMNNTQQQIVENIHGIIKKDSDGKNMIDFLGKESHELLCLQSTIQSANGKIIHQRTEKERNNAIAFWRERFNCLINTCKKQIQTYQTREKIKSKYSMLLDYIEQNRTLWSSKQE